MPDEVKELPCGVCLIRSARTAQGGSGLDYSRGIARETSGAQHLAMSLVIVPPGGAAHPHYHLAGETIIHILEGRAETRFGPTLARSVINGPGDFIFIPSYMPHQPVNLSASERGVAVNARNHPAQQEPLVPVDPAAPPDIALDPRGVLTLGPGVAGPSRLSMRRDQLAPGQESTAESPPAEAGVYVVRGPVAFAFGDHLQHSVDTFPGDFVFVPAGVLQQWRNPGPGAADWVVAHSRID